MKDLITAIASMLIIMLFVMQFTANQITYTKVMAAEYNIREFKILSESEGVIGDGALPGLRNNLAQIMECSPGEIGMRVEKGENKCTYEITMPVKGIIGPAHMLGISPEDNRRLHVSRGIIEFESEASEDKTEEEGEN